MRLRDTIFPLIGNPWHILYLPYRQPMLDLYKCHIYIYMYTQPRFAMLFGCKEENLWHSWNSTHDKNVICHCYNIHDRSNKQCPLGVDTVNCTYHRTQARIYRICHGLAITRKRVTRGMCLCCFAWGLPSAKHHKSIYTTHVLLLPINTDNIFARMFKKGIPSSSRVKGPATNT